MIAHSCQTTNMADQASQKAGPSKPCQEVVVKYTSTFAPFNSSVSRNKSSAQVNNPGPGSYDLEKHKENIPNESHVRMRIPNHELNIFKSKCKRFLDSANINPGPGKYNLNKEYKQKQIAKRGTHKMVEFFRNQKQRKQFIKWSSFDMGAPRRPSQSNKNPQAVFASKSSRQLFYKRPLSAVQSQKPKAQNDPKVKPDRSKLVSAMNVKKQRMSSPIQPSLCQQQMKKQNNNCWIGPGYYYHNESSISQNKKQDSFGNFGSKVPQSAFNFRSFNPPPVKIQEQPSPVFKSKISRFKDPEVQSIGPGQYQTKNDFSYLLFSNFKKGVENNFGRSSKRFVQCIEICPGPGDYHIQTQSRIQNRKASLKPHQRLKSACSIKNLKRKEKQLLNRFYLQNPAKGTQETQGDITTIQASECGI